MLSKGDVQELARAIGLPYAETETIASLWRRSLVRSRQLHDEQLRREELRVMTSNPGVLPGCLPPLRFVPAAELDFDPSDDIQLWVVVEDDDDEEERPEYAALMK